LRTQSGTIQGGLRHDQWAKLGLIRYTISHYDSTFLDQIHRAGLLHSGVDLAIGHIAKTWSSPAVASPPPLHDMSSRRTAAPALAP